MGGEPVRIARIGQLILVVQDQVEKVAGVEAHAIPEVLDRRSFVGYLLRAQHGHLERHVVELCEDAAGRPSPLPHEEA